MVKEEAGAGAGVAPGGAPHGHRRQESMYAMTGLYSESASTEDGLNEAQPPTNTGTHSRGHSRNASAASHVGVKCHSRNPSAIIVESVLRGDRVLPVFPPDLLHQDCLEDLQDCGILTCRPRFIQRFANIKVFVFLLSFLVTLQQALSSGYINSVITTIEKRFEIPSSLSGLIASSYEIGNVITVIFVSYLGSRRHIPVWIAVGSIIMGIGSMIFIVPHFIAEPHSANSLSNNSDNICRGVPVQTQDMGLGRLSPGLSSPALAPHNQLRGENCIKGSPSTALPVMLFLLAQLLLGCGGSPLFTLGTTYIDDHVRSESASLYIGCMYSMAAFGPVLGFLLGAYLLSFHMDSFTNIVEIDPGDRQWVGMWWGGFLLCGLLLILVAVPFYAFPKTLQREKERIRLVEKNQQMNKPTSTMATSTTTQTTTVTTTSPNQSTPPVLSSTTQAAAAVAATTATTAAPAAAAAVASASQSANEHNTSDSGYGKDVKDIPRSMWRLVCNPVYVVTCLGACMELIIVSGFVVFLPKYLETQFSLGKSQASVFTGSIAIPGACIGIFFGGCLLKRLELRPKGAVQFVLISNTICLACYGLLFFLGCDNVKMAGTTIPYFNSSKHEPFQVNLTAACNFGCECRMTEVEPVCGNNGLTYFSPCHAGCTSISSKNYSNCACIHANFTVAGTGLPSPAAAHTANPNTGSSTGSSAEFAEVTVVPVATAGPCNSPCRTIFPFLILLFFMTFVVAITQMPLLMIVLRSVNEEERSFALGMQFVIFRLFGYIPAPIIFGNVIDSTCLLWKSTCGEKGGRCLLYDIEQFRYKYVGICAGIKTLALVLFIIDWWLVRRRNNTKQSGVNLGELVGSIISLDKLFEERPGTLTLAAPANSNLTNDVPTVSGLGGPSSRSPTTPSPLTTPETPGSVTLAVKSLSTDDGSPAVPV